jgi:hypothetical protein
MSRYFFHVMNGKAVIDETGVDYPDLASMRREAISTAGQMLSSGEQTWNGKAWEMVVTDDSGTIVFGVSCSVDRHGL